MAVVVLLAMAGFLSWLGYARPSGLKVPSFVAYLLALTLAFAALALIARRAGRTAANNGLGAATLLGLAVAAAWISLPHPGTQTCVLRYSRATGEFNRPAMEASATTCRAVFGSGALICLLMACWAMSLWWQAKSELGR